MDDYEIIDFAYVSYRISRGDRIKFIHDFYGGQWIELRHKWFFWDRKRIQLQPDEILALKEQILALRHPQARRRSQPAGGYA